MQPCKAVYSYEIYFIKNWLCKVDKKIHEVKFFFETGY